MKIMIDTNVLVSAALNRNSTPFKAFAKAVAPPNKGIVCKQNIEELRRTFNRKLSHKIYALDSFLSISLIMLEIVSVPEEAHSFEAKVRDADDRPILRAAIAADADIIVTGDLDLLEADIKNPQILTSAQFLEIE